MTLETVIAELLQEGTRLGAVVAGFVLLYRRLRLMERKMDVTGMVICALAQGHDEVDEDRVRHALHENGVKIDDFRNSPDTEEGGGPGGG